MFDKMSSTAQKIELVKKSLKSYPDFPKQGILFWDIFAVLNNPEAAEALKSLLLDHCSLYKNKVQAVCALDSRGFLFGPLIANHLQIPFVPIRKKGKLPGEIKQVSYELEYGKETLEIQTNALQPGLSVLIVDDLLATGGSLAAGCTLVNAVGARVDHCIVIMELEELEGRKKVPSPVHSFIKL